MAYGDRVEYEAICNLTIFTADRVVYDAMFEEKEMKFFEYLEEGEDNKAEDLQSRHQFYGIPNYRRGPHPSAQSRNLRSDAVTENRSNISDDSNINSQFITPNIGFSETGLSVELTLAINDYQYSQQTGKLTIPGIENQDMYERPVLIVSIPVPDGANLAQFTITDEQSATESYIDAITMSVCDSEGCIETSLETTAFDDTSRADAHIENGKLYIRFVPIQYQTDTSQARISTLIKIQAEIEFPDFIPDSDFDTLPDYWETAYGLNPNIPNGQHGPNGDPDNDDRTNLQEYLELTNPILNQTIEGDATPPAPPEIITATPEENGVELTLTTSEDTCTVQFFYGEDLAGMTEYSLKRAADESLYSLSGLEDDTTYYITARAFDGAGNMSDASTAVSFQTPPGTAPDLPSEPIVTGELLTVGNPADEDFNGFRLYYGVSPDLSDAWSTFIFPDDGVTGHAKLSQKRSFRIEPHSESF